MKKITIALLSIFSLASCRKDRVCTCTYADGTVVSQNTYTNATKKEVRSLCTSSAQGVSCSVK